ncbi:MAG: 3-hydroxyacyl-CoA dehydrogenase NAD-binding domain-containing protein [Planctomycetes bacterium]|nr:3-hydroxyacyl-CoA dehydrogenase NAD-binding domain-containing protein [Planctomycetota bacterium]
MTQFNICTYAVIGAGNMGSGIAQKNATEGLPVTLVDLDQESADRGLERIRTLLNQGVERGVFRPQQAEAILGNVTATADWSALSDTDMVIEAVFENLDIKRDVFKQLGEVCRPDAILGTNTSSFFVKDVAEVTPHPERVVGLHYFFHPAMNRLVEVIGHAATTPEVFEAAWAAQEACGKTPIKSADAPGFVVNRYFVPWINESVRLLDEGVANIATVEWAAKKCFGVGMGPYQLMNVTGVPISLHAATTLGEQMGSFYAPASGLAAQVAAKQDWDLDGDIDESKFQAVSDRLLGVAFYIAAKLVEEGVGTVEDTDIGARVGLRWPRGPFQMINRTGLERAGILAAEAVKKHGLALPSMLKGGAESHIPISLVNYEESEQRATVKFNRPDAMNALNVRAGMQLMSALERARISGREGVVLQGTGKAFVAGADVKFFVNNLEKDNFDSIHAFAAAGHECYRSLNGKRQPSIARVHGLCLGGGAELAIACDWIVASPKAMFGFPETGIGIIPGLGGTQRLRLRTGLPLAKWMVYTGQLLDAETAKSIGLVDEVVPFAQLDATCKDMFGRERSFEDSMPSTCPVAHLQPLWDVFDTYSIQQILDGEADSIEDPGVQKAIHKIKSKSKHALLAAEQQMNNGASKGLDIGLSDELDSLKEVFLHEDALEGMKALLEGRKPEFGATN